VEQQERRSPDLYRTFSREQWAKLRASTPLEVTEEELAGLISFNDALSLDEVRDIYLPLSRLLNLYVGATQDLHRTTDAFFGRRSGKVPFVIGVAGSVAVGKSTTSRLLQLLLARWENHPRVDLVTTDGFLHPTAVLEARNLMGRKGFPESYDLRHLVQFLGDVKAGCPLVRAPVYSHLAYDILPGEHQEVRSPDILIFEGLNVLQPPGERDLTAHRPVASDYFDFSIYVGRQRALVRRALPRLPQDGLRRRALLLPPLCLALRRGGRADGPRHLEDHQPAQPARQHRADPGACPARDPQGRRPPRRAHLAAEAVATVEPSAT
jgi:type I pantothenate kinase